MTEDSRPTRLYELLADRSLVGLTANEEAELATLLDAHPDMYPVSFDIAAAATQLSMLGGKVEAMPEHLARKIEAAAKGEEPLADAPSEPQAAPQNVVVLPKSDPLRWAGWIAAAACLALAVGESVSRTPQVVQVVAQSSDSGQASTPIVPPVLPTLPARTAAELRDELSAKPSAVTIPWSATKDPAAVGASGDVVFSVAEQRGYMRFHGLAPNDPAAHQYQLWIFDKAQDKRYPIDGGVFDIAANGDVIVPIHAKIRVTDPTLFAVTIETPGGVVVSDRKHIVVTAARS